MEPNVEPQETMSRSPSGSPAGTAGGTSCVMAWIFAARIRTMFSWFNGS